MSDQELGRSAGEVEPKTAPSDSPHDHDHDHDHHHHGGRHHLRRLIHPISGRIFHIVHSPHEVEAKRHALLTENPKSGDFDILVHGTDEHVSVVRDCHSHQTSRRDALVGANQDLLTRYDHVRNELDVLSRELHELTDHAVDLDASFDKWGYSATIRTHGDSETSSLRDGSTHSVARHKSRKLDPIKFFKAPVIRQYFHKGLIWRSPQATELVAYQLFVDLVYVAVVDVLGEVAVTNASGASFLHYIIVFAISSKTFGDVVLVMNWFEINDIVGRLSVMFIVICLYSFASNTELFFETTYTAGLAFYLASRFFVASWFIFAAYIIRMVRWTLIFHAAATLLAAVLWIGSIHVEYPRNLPLIFIAIFIDIFGSQMFVPVFRILAHRYKNNKFLHRMTEYLPAVNIEHRVDRTNAFISLVIGYGVIKIFFQSSATFPMNAFLGKGILGLIQAFAFNWIYFEIDNEHIHVHAIRRHHISTGIWNTAHIPFSAAYILAASTLSELVIAHDCSDANPETLSESYAASSREEVDSTLRWFYCGGIGAALIFMAVISLTHIHKKIPNAKLSKRMRLTYRVAVAIVIICLPLAESLSSLDLITITACLVVSVLILDIFGNSCAGESFWSGGFCSERRKNTQYTAKCSLSARKRKQIRQAVQRGDKIDLQDILRKDGSVSSFESADTRVDNDEDKGAGSY